MPLYKMLVIAAHNPQYVRAFLLVLLLSLVC